MAQLLPVLALSLLPIVLTGLGLLWVRLDARCPSPRLPIGAGPWVERTIARLGLPIPVEVVPAESPDAYWPNVGSLALSERTWAGREPRDWAIAAHELGHAQNTALHPAFPRLLPGLRLIAGLGWRITVGTMFAAVLMAEPAVLQLGLVTLVISLGATALVCVDEIAASARAAHTLAQDPEVTRPMWSRATSAMVAAGGAYVLGGIGQLGVLAAWPFLTGLVTAAGPDHLEHPSDLGLWLVFGMVPVVVVRTAVVLQQVVSPEPVPTDLDLWALLARESQWEWTTAVGTLSVVATLHDAISGIVLAVAVAGALAASLGAIHALTIAVLALPVVLWRRVFGEPPAPRWPKRARDDIPQAMIEMWSDPPWYLRVAWLVPLAYLPLVGLLVSYVLLPR